MKSLVILGSGLAGYTVAREFRKLDATRPVILITSDKGDFYSKPALSNALAQKRTVPSLVTTPAAKMAEQLSLTLLTGVNVTGLDTSTQTVHTSVGAVEYGDLVLALGASAVRAPLTGSAAGEVMSVNSLEDYAEFRSRLEGKRRVLVVGAGLIGCEFANDLALGGYAPVVVAPAEEALSTLLPVEASKRLQVELERVGVTWALGTTVAALDHAGDRLQATLSSGARLEVDVAISAIGLQPNTALARDAGLAVERGILVDRYARTSANHVFALGDCAQYVEGVLPFVQPLMTAAKAVTATLAGRETSVEFGHLAVLVKTTSHPVVAYRKETGDACVWTHHAAESGSRLLLHAEDGTLRGFALTGSLTSERTALLRQLPAPS